MVQLGPVNSLSLQRTACQRAHHGMSNLQNLHPAFVPCIVYYCKGQVGKEVLKAQKSIVRFRPAFQRFSR